MTTARLLCEAVIFDLDGVLVDSERVNVRSAFEAFERFGHPLPDDASSKIVGRHPHDYVPVLAGSFGLTEEQQHELIRWQNEAYIRRWAQDASTVDGARDVLIELRRRRFRLALATSAGRGHVRHCLDRFDFHGLFEVVMTKDDVEHRKPDPEVYLGALDRLGLSASRAVVVEDSAHGIEAARAAGVRCIAVRTPFTPPERIAQADAAVCSVREVGRIVTRPDEDPDL